MKFYRERSFLPWSQFQFQCNWGIRAALAHIHSLGAQ